MGSSVSAILAILYMDHVEKKALNILEGHIACYCRNVDDVFVLVRNCDEAEHVKLIFNEVDPHIQFDIERPNSNNTLKLLDISIHITSDGQHQKEFYKKLAKKPIFVNFKSAVPMRSKMHYIRNERNRIRSRCSDNNINEETPNQFRFFITPNGYPDKLIHNRLTSNS